MGRFTRTPGPLGTIVGALVIWLGVVIAVGASTAPRQTRPAETPKAAPAAKATPAQSPSPFDHTCVSTRKGRTD